MRNRLQTEFESLWQSAASPPDVFQFLSSSGEVSAGDIAAVIEIDQQYRWRTDAPLAVAAYVARFPEMETNKDLFLELTVNEFRARLSSGQSPSIEEYTQEFPALSDRLQKKLAELKSGDSMAREEAVGRPDAHLNEEEKSRWFGRFYDELRRLASSKTRSHDGGREVTLQPTALVNELFLKWHDSDLPAGIPDSQLKGIAARALMQILLDHDRKRKADRRGGGVVQTVPLDDMIDDVIVRIGNNLESLQASLQELELHNPLYAEIVFRKFFSGESHEEIAIALGQTTRQIEHAWYAARDWLREKLNRDM